MDDTQKRLYAQVFPIAEQLVEKLEPSCKRIEIAGSLRRKRPEIGDIELVAIPGTYKEQIDLFGGTQTYSWLDETLAEWMDSGFVRHAKNKRWGDKLKAFEVRMFNGGWYKVDLFIQPDPATWGVNMLIRTGSWQFSRWMVTPQSKGGAMPDEYRVRDARVWAGLDRLETPEEEDMFRLWGMEFVPPEERERE